MSFTNYHPDPEGEDVAKDKQRPADEYMGLCDMIGCAGTRCVS